jgi:hypothetical protein
MLKGEGLSSSGMLLEWIKQGWLREKRTPEGIRNMWEDPD